MSLGEVVQSIVGGLAIFSAIVVARMVYRLEKRDRDHERDETKQEQDKSRAEQRQLEEARQQEEREREARAIRREQHKGDYQAATDALNRLDKLLDQVERSPYDSDQLDAAGLDDLMDTFMEIGKRVPHLDLALSKAWSVGSELELNEFPSRADISWATNASGDEAVEQMSALLRRSALSAIGQQQAVMSGRHAVTSARKAIVKEWGS